MPQEKKNLSIKEKQDEYPIHVVGRHVSITDPMKAYAVEKLKKVSRFGGRVIEATIIMDIQKLVHAVDFIINVNNTKIKVSGKTENMYASIDQAIEHLEAKLCRYLKRLHMHHTKPSNPALMNVAIIERPNPVAEINDQIEEETLARIEEELRPNPVVKKVTKPLKVLNQQEVVMKMELSEDIFLIYRSEEDQKLKVIYRREDNTYGIIEPE